MNKYTLLYIVLVCLSITLVHSDSITVYVDSKSTNNNLDCGNTTDNACASLLSAINAFKNSNASDLSIQINGGQYPAVNNTNLEVFNMSISIGSTVGATEVPSIDLGQNQFLIAIEPENYQPNGFDVSTQITLQNISISNGQAPNGGIIHIQTNTSAGLMISSCDFTSNSGSVIYTYSMTNSIVILINNQCYFTNNNGSAGAIFNGNNVTANIYNSYIINNTASFSIISMNSGFINFVNLVYSNNYIGYSAHFDYYNTRVIVDKSVFTNNSAHTVNQETDLGLISANKGIVTLTNLIFDSNVNLAAIKSVYTTTTLNNVTISNVVSPNSFSFYAYGSYITISNSFFTNNTVGSGIISANLCPQLNIESSIIQNNIFLYPNNSYEVTLAKVDGVTIQNSKFQETNKEIGLIYCLISSIILNNNTVIGPEYGVSCVTVNKDNYCQISGTDDVSCISSDSNSHEKKDGGLTKGQIIGIVIGTIVGLAAFALVIYIIYKRHHNRMKYRQY